jgi:hypothetical protein
MTRLPRILYAVPQTLHARFEIAKAIQALSRQDAFEKSQRPSEAHTPSDMQEAVAETLRGLLRELRKTSFNADEPRVPAGNPDGGQWTGDGRNGTSTRSSDSAGEGATDVRLAMEPTDPVTGAPFSSETPINRLGGGEGGGGGFGEGSGGGLSEAAAADARDAGPPQIGSFTSPDNLTYGTTLFGNYAHAKIADFLRRLYPDVQFRFDVLPGQRGVDVTVLSDPFGRVGYQFGEIKPLTASGESAFNRQLQQWGVAPVQSITYDAAGNVYYGFR